MRTIILSTIGVLILLSCSSEDVSSYPVGSDFIENEIQVRVIDTFSIKTGTFKLDSLITSSTNRILIGSVSDANFGHLTAQSYFQLISSSFSIPTNAIYDSIGFSLNYDSYYYGDTLQTQTYNIHRVLETFEPIEGSDFYNTSKLNYDSESLGELSFIPNPKKSSDSIYISMNHEFGEDLFNKIIKNDINNSDDLLQEYKGFTIIPNNQINSHILGFNVLTSSDVPNNSSMRLFYTVKDDDSEDNNYYIDFYISSSSNQFNNISADLSDTDLNKFENVQTIIPTSETDNLIFSQAITGITSRIEIPYLKNLNKIATNGTTLNAELTFSPHVKNHNDLNKLKDSLQVFIVDHKNRISNQLLDLSGNVSYAILNKNEYEFNDNIFYSLDMSSYVEEILNTGYDLNYALMVQFLDYDKTVDNVTLKSNDMKLTVNYLNY